MQSIIEFIFGAEGIFTKFKYYRNKVIYSVESAFFIVSLIMFLNSILMLALGINLTGADTFVQYGKTFEKLIHDAFIYIMFMFIFLVSIAFIGGFISLDRMMPSWCVAGYGIVVFFLTCLPCLVEGGILLDISQIKPTQLDQMCEINP